jgi:hypothetical protein
MSSLEDPGRGIVSTLQPKVCALLGKPVPNSHFDLSVLASELLEVIRTPPARGVPLRANSAGPFNPALGCSQNEKTPGD